MEEKKTVNQNIRVTCPHKLFNRGLIFNHVGCEKMIFVNDGKICFHVTKKKPRSYVCVGILYIMLLKYQLYVVKEKDGKIFTRPKQGRTYIIYFL